MELGVVGAERQRAPVLVRGLAEEAELLVGTGDVCVLLGEPRAHVRREALVPAARERRGARHAPGLGVEPQLVARDGEVQRSLGVLRGERERALKALARSGEVVTAVEHDAVEVVRLGHVGVVA